LSVKNSRKNLFCCWYSVLGNAEEAAVKAGFEKQNALSDGISCLKSAECQKTIAEIRSALADKECITSGLKRLAFGSSSDAVYLAFSEEMPSPEILRGLDLFNVSEIKRVKGGGVEIKLFDRIKALEKLYELENAFNSDDKAESLINALISSASGGDYSES